MKTATLHRWRFVHTWSSLVCTAFLLMLCVTGLFLIWIDEIDATFAGHPVPPSRPAAAQLANLDDVFARALERVPGERVTHADWAFDGVLLGVNLAPLNSDKRSRQLVFDARSGEFMEDTKTDNPNHPVRVFLRIVNRLHITMFAGLPGEFFLAGMTVLFVVATVSGVVLYAPFRRGLQFGTVRSTHERSRLLDLHNLLGIVTLGWVLVVSITGIMNAFTVPLYAAWRQATVGELAGEFTGKLPHSTPIGPQAALEAAYLAAPESRMVRIVPPGGWQGSPGHWVVWVQGATPVQQKIFRPILVDAQTSEIGQSHAPPWYLQALQMSRPLHFGDYGGAPLKVLWSLFDLIAIYILISGWRLWWRRARGASNGSSST